VRIFYSAIIVSAFAVLAPTAGLQAQNPSTPPAKPAPSTPSTTTKVPAGTPDPALLHPTQLTDHAPATFQVKFTTTRGNFIVTVTRAWAPLGADRFYNLVKHHFYDGAAFFRVLKGFVAQFGISPSPAVTAVWRNADIKDDPVTTSNKRGYLVFATSGPNTRTTQLFINLADNKSLDARGFAPFGQVTQGMAVVDSLYQGYGEGGTPGGGPDQEEMERQGKPYVDKGWPKLDTIKSAALYTAPATPAAPKTPASSTKS
jgi:peptidyl-prolyl cis-trans isomerase A (cyclophilin A)